MKFAFLVFFLSFSIAADDKTWEKQFSEWNARQVSSLLEDSPWCRTMTLGNVLQESGAIPDRVVVPSNRNRNEPRGHGLDQQTGITGEKEILHAYSVRLFSAPVVRQGYARMRQLQNGYDKLPAEQQRAWDDRLARLLNLDVSNRVVVSLDFASNTREMPIEVNRQLATATAASLKQRAYLITARLGRIEVTDYVPPSGDGMGAKFVFPRLVSGQPLLTAADKELVFELMVPGVEHKVFVTWNTARLMHAGSLEY
ncbi:MAG: hypothetical protein EHM61_16475 [Acidobacteria bacterium]|nr:MAG: hypothetical protein EHM61_16475 [Acidobacteriota bacterium]